MSEPQHIVEILPEVMADIETRCNDYRRRHGMPLLEESRKNGGDHRAQAFRATQDFLEGNMKQSEHRKARKQKAEQGKLF